LDCSTSTVEKKISCSTSASEKKNQTTPLVPLEKSDCSTGAAEKKQTALLALLKRNQTALLVPLKKSLDCSSYHSYIPVFIHVCACQESYI